MFEIGRSYRFTLSRAEEDGASVELWRVAAQEGQLLMLAEDLAHHPDLGTVGGRTMVLNLHSPHFMQAMPAD